MKTHYLHGAEWEFRFGPEGPDSATLVAITDTRTFADWLEMVRVNGETINDILADRVCVEAQENGLKP